MKKPSQLFFSLLLFSAPLLSLTIEKKGTLPSYAPYANTAAMLFLPYNPNVLIVKERCAKVVPEIARMKERSRIYCFTPNLADYQKLEQLKTTFPNIHPNFGFVRGNKNSKGTNLYFCTKNQPAKTPDNHLFSGSPLQPINRNFDVLFGEKSKVPCYSLSRFLSREGLQKLHFIHLDSGGQELQVLKGIKHFVEGAIVIKVKTYHKRLRKGMILFKELQQFMYSYDFELMSHYIYDDVLGDALFVKKKYIDAVFRSKEQ